MPNPNKLKFLRISIIRFMRKKFICRDDVLVYLYRHGLYHGGGIVTIYDFEDKNLAMQMVSENYLLFEDSTKNLCLSRHGFNCAFDLMFLPKIKEETLEFLRLSRINS